MRKWLVFGVAAIAVCVSVFAYRAYLIQQLREPVLAQLNDPDSAKFQNERFIGNWTVSGGVLCGDVNAKNLMGGYVGFKPFEAGAKVASIGGNSDLVKVCDFEDDIKKSAPWWWLTT